MNNNLLYQVLEYIDNNINKEEPQNAGATQRSEEVVCDYDQNLEVNSDHKLNKEQSRNDNAIKVLNI